jgi:small subunit ribosomal protein S1
LSPKALAYYLCFVIALFIAAYSFFFLAFNTYFQFFGSAGGFISATAILLLLINTLPAFQKTISPILASFKWIKRADMASIAYNIQGSINQFRETVNKESADLIPEAEVEWVTETSKESFFDNFKGKVIIRMNPCENNDINLARASLLQVSKGVIPESRLYIDSRLNTAIDLSLVKKILLNQGKKNAYRYFISEITVPELADEAILQNLEQIETIEESGLFTRLFLRQLKELPVIIGLNFQNLTAVRDDVNNFFEYSQIVANRKEHEKITLDYEGTHIKSAIIYVAMKHRMTFEGARPYIKRALINKKNKREILFFIAFAHAIEFTRGIIDILIKNYGMELVPYSDREYVAKNTTWICATILVNQNFIVKTENDLVLHDLLAEAIKSTTNLSGWADLQSIEKKIQETVPKFNVKDYGFSSLADLLMTLKFIKSQSTEGVQEFQIQPGCSIETKLMTE